MGREARKEMCQRCSSDMDPSPFQQKSVTMDGLDANATKEEQTGGHSWEQDPQTRSQFIDYARNYMEWVFENYDFEVLTRDMVSMRDSGRMSRLLGRCDENEPYDTEIILSWDAYNKRNYDWERLRNTVKHELVHASNFVEFGHMGHGPTFIREAKRLEVTNIARYSEPDPRYFIVCSECGLVLWRQKRSKKVKQAENEGRLRGHCANCSTNNWDVLTEPPAKHHPVWTQKRP